METWIFLGLLIVALSVITPSCGQDCVWPNYFDLSNFNPWKDRSWETEIKIDTDFITINSFSKQRKSVAIISNNTFQITEQVGKQLSDLARYECDKKIDDDTFVIRSIPVEDLPQGKAASANIQQTRYRCMKLIKRSKHVIQWRLGEASQSQLSNCPETFPETPEYDWPLVHFPIRNTADDHDILTHLYYLDEYPECPDLPTKGYLMKVTNAECSNNHPSPRFEMKCTIGEGLRMIPSPSAGSSPTCSVYSFLGDTGSKMYCLGHWADDRYMYTVLAPAASDQIESFHCLRLNKDDPTSEDAILFLNTVCKSTAPAGDDQFLRIKLREKKIDKMCDNYDDGCNSASTCTNLLRNNSCFESCKGSCPVKGETITSDEQLQGTWIIQRRTRRYKVAITLKEFDLGELGKFHAYGSPSDDQCVNAPKVMEGAISYVLAKLDPESGCTPRVTQFRMKKVTDAVALMQVLETSPLRYNKFASNPDEWCHNNREDSKAFSHIYQPLWPYISSSPHGKGSGWFTLIHADNQNAASCLQDKPEYQYATHTMVKLEFISPSQKHICNGEVRVWNDNKYSIDYSKCVNEGSYGVNLDLECRGSYQFNDKYLAVIGKVSTVVTIKSERLLSDEFYCLLVPTEEHKDLPVLMHTAGDCDGPTIQFVTKHYRKPVLKMTYLDTIGGASVKHASMALLLTSIVSIFCIVPV